MECADSKASMNDINRNRGSAVGTGEVSVSTTSPAGGLCLALPGHVAFPPKGGLTNHFLVTGGRLKAALFYFSESPSKRSLSY